MSHPGVQYDTEEEQNAITNGSRKSEVAGPNRNDAQLWTFLMVKVKSSAGKSSLS